MWRSLYIAVTVLLVSCSGDEITSDPNFCTEELRPGLEITVKEAQTGAILTEGITVLADDGNEVESLTNFTNSDVFVGAYEKPGSFTITVGGEGYVQFVATEAIVVEADACHVITEKREVILERER